MLITETGLTLSNNPFAVFNNLVTTDELTLSTVGGGFVGASSGTNLLDPRTNIVGVFVDALEGYVTVSNATIETDYVDTICLAGHNLGVLNRTDGTEFRLHLQTLDGSWGNITPPVIHDGTDSPIIFLLEQNTFEKRIIIEAVPAVASRVVIGYALFGERVEIPSAVVYPFTSLLEDTNSVLNTNESWNGHYLGSVVTPKAATGTIRFAATSASWVDDTDFRAFQEHFNSGTSFFFMPGPIAAPKEGYYLWRDKDPLVPKYNRNPLYKNIELRVKSHVH